MDQLYRDYAEGNFIPTIEVTKLPENGHFRATALGMTVTHHDGAEAVNRLTDKIREGLAKGEITPFQS